MDEPEQADMTALIDGLNARAARMGRSLRFALDDHTGAIVVLVMDAASGRTVSEIPAEHFLRALQALETLMKEP